jgi:hypothetical protein
MKENIFIQDGATIRTLNPSSVVQALIFSEEQRAKIKQLLKHGFFPKHTSVGRGKSTEKHWNVEKYNGRFGKGFKMITTSPYSTNFNHLTYFIKML